MYRTDFWTLWEKARVGWSERTALKQGYYQGWNRLPTQVGCMRQVLRAGALGRPRGMGWRGRRERGLGWGTHVNPWLIHVNVWQKPLQYCKVISLQLIKINEKKKSVSNLCPQFLAQSFKNSWNLSDRSVSLLGLWSYLVGGYLHGSWMQGWSPESPTRWLRVGTWGQPNLWGGSGN